MDTIGPISRTVEDAAITLSAIAGYDARDPSTWNTPVPEYRQSLNGDIRGLRVGIVTELLHSDLVEPDVADAVSAAASTLAELGVDVEEVSIPLAAHANAISGALLAVEPAVNMRDWVRERIHDFGHDNRIGLLTGSLVPAQAYYKAQKLRTLLRNEVLAAFETYDVLAMPTSGRQAVPLTEDPPVTSKETSSRLSFMRTNTFNLASSPAISVPCGFGGRGLPVGLQIAGPPGGEEMVFRVAHAYEQNTDWHTMRPPTADI